MLPSHNRSSLIMWCPGQEARGRCLDLAGSVHYGVRSGGPGNGELPSGAKREHPFGPDTLFRVSDCLGKASGVRGIEPRCSWRRHAAHDVFQSNSMQRACLWQGPSLVAWTVRRAGFCWGRGRARQGAPSEHTRRRASAVSKSAGRCLSFGRGSRYRRWAAPILTSDGNVPLRAGRGGRGGS